jgi:formylglycine-generating enzyme required for sulfatase activity
MQYNGTVLDNAWHHCAWVVPDSAIPVLEDVKVYLDGQRLTGIDWDWQGNSASAEINTLPGFPFSLGTWRQATWLNGALDEVRIYDRALSESEILEQSGIDCPPTPLHFVEEFNGTLEGCWTWEPREPLQWDLSSRPGWLVATTEADLLYMLRNRPDTSFVAETHLQIDPVLNYHSAGLVYWKSESQFIAVRRHFDGPHGGQVITVQTGNACGPDGYIPCAATDLYLRMIVVGNELQSFWSPDDSNWIFIQSNSCAWIGDPDARIGICQSHGLDEPPSIEVNFDFFRIFCLPPMLTTFDINGGELRTTSPVVTLAHTLSGTATEYMASEDPSFADASWQPYEAVPTFTLSSGYGVKIIHLKFRNVCGETAIVADAVILEPQPPAAVTGLVIKAASNRDDIELHWSPIAGADLYAVYSARISSFEPADTSMIALVSTPDFIDGGRIRTDVTRYYKVTAILLPTQMTYVPASVYEMGAAFESNAMPMHFVEVPPYFIDMYEVTNKEYRAFCIETNRVHPPDPGFVGMSNYFESRAFENYPVVNVSWQDAYDYAAWIGKRLPTEAEWELAAKGSADNRLWPWGDTWIGANANILNNPADGYSNTAPIGSYANGISPTGCYDMAGNVWDWCNDWFSSAYYGESPYYNPLGPPNGTLRVMRGGAWQNTQVDAQCAWRDRNDPATRHFALGFRCVLTP